MDIKKNKRIVIKIGSALLVDNETGKVNSAWLTSLVDDVALLIKSGKEVIIVSSGAVALGRQNLKVGTKKLKLEEKQAAAACGQLALVGAYSKALEKHEFSAAQILLTIEDSENRRRYLNAKNTLETLLAAKIVPVINENDTVATAEIRFGDNDRLAARVAEMMGADLLILFSDVDGLYTANPKADKNARHISKIEAIDRKIEAMADGVGSEVSSGGMITKIAAAKIATTSGCSTIIALGTVKNPIKNLLDGGKHSLFTSTISPHGARKRWIAHSLNVSGELHIDDGAVRALKKGNSLLPAGVTKVKGEFERGDAVLIIDKSGKTVARGLTAYSASDARKIIGKKTTDIEKILDYSGRDEIIHRDNLVLAE